jgi:hypothetical protein
MTLNLDARLGPVPDVLFQRVGEEAVLLDLNGEQYFGLNEVGARAWELLGEHSRVEAVCASLLLEFEVGEDELRSDLELLLADLAAAGLIRELPDDATP